MLALLKKRIRQRLFSTPIPDTDVVEAYNIWAESYDHQPGNLMLDLDAKLFMRLLSNINMESKTVADIGCGTGRHWANLFAGNLSNLTGFDVSPGMLNKLNQKYPAADTQVIANDHFAAVADDTYDVIVSTLTVAHIKNLEDALNAWCRIAKASADLIITDFHPDALALGGRRTFSHNKELIAVTNYIHPVTEIKRILQKNGFSVVNELEIMVDETVRHYYTAQKAEHVYDKFYGRPIIYGIHLKR